MKRFSKTISTVLLVALLAVSLIGCQSTAKTEAAPEIVVQPAETSTVVAPAPAPAPVQKPAPAPAPALAPAPEPTPAPAPVVAEPEPVPVVEEVVVVEPAPVVEEVVEATVEEPVVYPYGVTEIVKNTQGDKEFDLYIVHTNDVHARVVPQDGGMGYAKLSTMLNVARDITDNILLLDAGDVTHGTNFANMFQGRTVGELLMMLGYDAVAPGNHDFNYGYENLVELAQYAEDNSNLRVLAANITDENGYLVFQPYQIYRFNDFKVCVLGLTTPDTKEKSHPKNTVGLDFMSDEVIQNAQYAIDLAHEYADYVIVLGHIGLDDDGTSAITSKYICENIKGIDLFVDGHSHSVLENGLQVGDSLIVSAGEYLKYVGVVEIHVNGKDAKITTAMLIPATDVLDPANSELAKSFGIVDIPDDPKVDEYIDYVNSELEKVLDTVIANIPSNLDGERSHVRTKKTNLSTLICAAMTEESGADFTITNGGGIRASLAKGDVTLGDVNNVLPFTNTITVCEISPADVYAALEWGYRMLPETNGGFSQTDLQVVYSKYSPAGSRIKRVLLNGQVLDKNDTTTVLKVATNDFMAAGGDGYTMFGKVLTEGKVLNEVFADYLAKHYPAN